MNARVRFAAAACALSLAVSGCTTGEGKSIGDQAKEGSQKGYISGDGTIERIPSGGRGEPVDLSGSTLTGQPWAAADARGTVVVLNKWGSWCEPCQVEMPHLQAAWVRMQQAKKPVLFLGINVQEGAQTGAAAARRFGLTFPSLSDQYQASLLALQGKAAATPTTLILDRRGRIAARVVGPVDSVATLTGLIDDVLTEPA